MTILFPRNPSLQWRTPRWFFIRLCAPVLFCFFSSGLGALESFVKELSPADPLVRVMDVDLVDAGLDEVVKQMTVRSGCDVLFGEDIALPAEFARRRLFVETRNLSVRNTADWIARSLGTRYRVADGGRTLLFTSSYGFLDQVQPSSNFLNLGGLTTRGEQEAFLAVLKELLKVYLLKEPEYTLRLQGTTLVLMAHLPPVLHDRLKKIFRLMSRDGEAIQDPGVAEEFSLPRTALDTKVSAVFDNWTLPDILRDLSFQTATNIGFDHLPFAGKDMPVLTLELEESTLEEVLKEISNRVGFQATLPAEGGGLWLSADPGKSRRLGSREVFWEDLPIHAYSVLRLVEKIGKEKVVTAASEAIASDLRQDLSVGVAYHESSGNLIVIAPASQQLSIRARLFQMMQESVE